jgi:hypothetical protein
MNASERHCEINKMDLYVRESRCMKDECAEKSLSSCGSVMWYTAPARYCMHLLMSCAVSFVVCCLSTYRASGVVVSLVPQRRMNRRAIWCMQVM